MLVTATGCTKSRPALWGSKNLPGRTTSITVRPRFTRTLTAISAALLTGLFTQASVADSERDPSTSPVWQGGLAFTGSGARATRSSIVNLQRGRASMSNGSQHSELTVLSLTDEDAFDSRAGAELNQTTFSMTQRAGDGFLHFGSQVSDDEYRVNSGFSLGRAMFMASVGSGDSATQLGAGGFGFIDPHFFHGGLYQSFHSRSAALAFDLNDSLTAHVSHLTIDSAGVDQRSTSTFGLTGSRWHSHALHVQRGDDTAGRGLDLGFSVGRFDTQVQALQTSTQAYSARLSLGFFNSKSRHVQFHVQHDKNPLYTDGEDSRFMLSYSGMLGSSKTMLFQANESDSATTEEQDEARRRNRKTLMIAGIAAGAAAGVALAASSGDGDNDNNARFPSERSAARNILNNRNPVSVRENREYGGWVYRRRDGTFSFTNPNKGDIDSVTLGDINAIPRGARTTASYHTHAAFDPRYDSENFSPQDKFVSRVNQVDGYLATPFGKFKFYNWRSDVQTTLGNIAN